jgi:hypothetical protein
MVSSGATWTTRLGLRWFVRGAAVFVGLACMVGVVVWDVGGFYYLGGEGGSPWREAVPSVLAAVAAGLLTSEIVLRAFDLPGRGFWHRYGVVVVSVCIGGAIEGGLLGWVFAMDGTLFPEPPPEFYAEEPLRLLGDLAWSLIAAAPVGAVLGLAAGLAAGLVLGVPLAAVLGTLRDD